MQHILLTQALNRAERNRPDLGTRIVARIVGFGRARWQAYRDERRYRSTVRTLSGLDDRTLHDIGVHRSEIESYASAGGAGRYPDRFVAQNPFPRG